MCTECPLKNQVYLKCGTACPPTCSNPNPRNCTLPCVEGCQCRRGRVLDEVQNKCVKLNKCCKVIYACHCNKVSVTCVFQLVHQPVLMSSVAKAKIWGNHAASMYCKWQNFWGRNLKFLQIFNKLQKVPTNFNKRKVFLLLFAKTMNVFLTIWNEHNKSSKFSSSEVVLFMVYWEYHMITVHY